MIAKPRSALRMTIAAFMATLLLFPTASIPQEAKKEAGPPYNDDTDDPAVWGKAFPKHYELYKKTVDMQRTKHGGSEAVPHKATQADPRSVVARSKSDEDAGLRAIWAGYAFAADFREERGHAYMLEDQKLTQRQVVVKQPGACINCHASMYVAYKKAGGGDITKGFEKINAMPYAEAAKLVNHPVACIDCHDGKTLALRVSRPAFIEGIRALKATQGVKDYDVNKQASSNEMRAYVCGQCHVEYYFKGDQKRLTYPWAKGIKVEEITAYYDEIGFRDWTHKDTGAPALKAQHPEFEMWSQGPHARAGVTCSDCHMPSISGSFTDHWVRSPVLNIEAACVTCHKKHDDKVTAVDLKARVDQIQDRHWELREKAMTAVVGLINDLKKAKAAGRTEADLKTALYLQRRAQFYLDFAEAENSTGFHAPQEGARILGESMDFARQGQIALRDKNFKPTVPVVDIPPPPAAPAKAAEKSPAKAPEKAPAKKS
ncbi:ammonia-forming cytochrome c nitrite reductase subunit c552 [Usitatibacter palustris]|uniref:nitrite reductase (cytochrome; ammonia-forming) n=1 Tax=Usitatibacter palustris TaxID=2732487 RepID=A0A6M4H7M5_9PROT|nr:ammonia-forming cytochrome c nitrite reductase subunit c552 [Usitatibacter palustris]QJR15616.1 Cytochrome c-552 [Usitatibacter palustris]